MELAGRSRIRESSSGAYFRLVDLPLLDPLDSAAWGFDVSVCAAPTQLHFVQVC